MPIPNECREFQPDMPFFSVSKSIRRCLAEFNHPAPEPSMPPATMSSSQ